MMNIKLQTGICLSIFLLCSSVLAQQFQLGPVYTGVKNEVSFIVTFPEEDITPKATEFQLFEDDKLLETAVSVKRLDQSEKGLVLLFCIDVSGSMKKAVLREIQDSLTSLLTHTETKNKYGVVSFANRVIIEPDITNDREILKSYIRNLNIRGKKTVLYEAIFDALEKLNADIPNEYRRILVISDGKNENSESSYVSPETLIELSRTYGIPIDAIGRGIIDKQYTDSLRGLANSTNGRFIHVQPDSISLRDAIIRMHKSLLEKTWVVNFRYETKAEEPAVENAVITFERNGSFSAIIDQEIPRPLIKKVEIDWKKLLLFLGFIFLFIFTLFFIFWLIRRRNRKDDDTKVEPPTNEEVEITPPITPAVKSQGRQTMVGSISTPILQTNQSQPEISLEVINGPLKGQQIIMDKQSFRIGSNQYNDLVLADDEFVSGSHVLLSYINGKLQIADQNSLNGTLLNGENIDNKTLQAFPNDEIQIGNSSFRIMEF